MHSPKTNTMMKLYKCSKQPANIQATQLYYTEHPGNPHHTNPKPTNTTTATSKPTARNHHRAKNQDT